MPFAMILAYVPEITQPEYQELRLKEAVHIARERDQEAADNLLFDCNPELFDLSPSVTLTASDAA